MPKKKLEEMNLLDDFLFGSVVTYPEIGERFSRDLLKIIFQKDFGKLTVVPQKTYYGSDTDLHGTRLDVYLEESAEEILPENVTIYDVEPDKNDDSDNKRALPKRVRFYHAKIDAHSLKAGESYHALKKVIIVMIMPYDPFGWNQMVYTIGNGCKELPEMPYDDGAKTVFLYTKGDGEKQPKELRQLLHYMEETNWKNASNAMLEEIQKMVDTVKQDEGVSLSYMKIHEWEEEFLNRGRKEGREEEKVNTERERKRAEAAEQEASTAKEKAEVAEEKAEAAEMKAEAVKQKAAEMLEDTAQKLYARGMKVEEIADIISADIPSVIRWIEKL